VPTPTPCRRLLVIKRQPEKQPARRSGSFLGDYLRNLLLIALILGAIALFVLVFYPKTLEVFAGIAFVYSALKLWPIIILILLLAAIPWRRR
jgi:hypothetical protein